MEERWEANRRKGYDIVANIEKWIETRDETSQQNSFILRFVYSQQQFGGVWSWRGVGRTKGPSKSIINHRGTSWVGPGLQFTRELIMIENHQLWMPTFRFNIIVSNRTIIDTRVTIRVRLFHSCKMAGRRNDLPIYFIIGKNFERERVWKWREELSLLIRLESGPIAPYTLPRVWRAPLADSARLIILSLPPLITFDITFLFDPRKRKKLF